MALENQQLFRAPTLPKMGKDSSPLMKGAKTIGSSFAKPKLKASKMSFVKVKNAQAINPEDLKLLKTSKMSFVRAKKAQAIKAEDLKGPETVSTGSLASSLTETNKILVEIQNQLSIDFANRIAEKKQTLKLSRKQVKKKKLAAKEDFVERGRGKGLFGNIKDFGKKVLSPVKGIFDKIIKFLTIVGTGIALNAAFEWLRDEENQEKLVRVFNFLRDHWETLLAITIGGKIIGLLLKLKGLFSLARSLVRRIGSLSGKKPPKPIKPPGSITPTPKGLPNKTPTRTPTPRTPTPRAPTPRPGAGSIKDLFGKPMSSSGMEAFKGAGSGSGVAPQIPKPGQGLKPNLNIKPGSNFKMPRITPGGFIKGAKTFGIGIALQMGGEFLITQGINAAFGTPEERLQKFKEGYDNATPERRAKGIAGMQRDYQNQLAYQKSPLHLIDKALQIGGQTRSEKNLELLEQQFQVIGVKPKTATESDLEKYGEIPKGYKLDRNGKIVKLNLGGTVPGEGPTNVDSVPAMLTPKEEVIQAPAANRFRPVLKDINNNYGRMFLSFTSGVEKQARNFTLQQEETNRSISLFKEFGDLVEKRVRKLELKELEKPGGFLDLLNRMQGGQSERETQTVSANGGSTQPQTTLASLNSSSTQPKASLMSNTTPIFPDSTMAFIELMRMNTKKEDEEKKKTETPNEKSKLDVKSIAALLDKKVKTDPNLPDSLLSENIKVKTPQITGTVGKPPVELPVIPLKTESIKELETYDHRKGSSGEGTIETMNLNLPPTVIQTPKQQQQVQPQEQPRESSSSDILIAPMDLDNPFFGRSFSAYGVEL